MDAYQAMERAVEAGKLKSIGLSNYYDPDDFDRLVSATTIKPALLQNETHPYHQGGAMKAHIARYGTVLESWFPLGGRGNTQILFNDPVIAGDRSKPRHFLRAGDHPLASVGRQHLHPGFFQ